MNLGRFVNPWAWLPRGEIDRPYEPADDPVFLKQCNEELARWRDWRDGKQAILPPEPHEGPPDNPCVRCGKECREENLFCTEACFAEYKAEKEKP